MIIKKNSGFTLIELVVVIVILGILSVTAAPKFLNLQEDARISTIYGIKAAVISAAEIVYSKAAIQGLERATGGSENGEAIVEVDGMLIEVKHGYPEAQTSTNQSLVDVLTLAEEVRVCFGSGDTCNGEGYFSSNVFFSFDEFDDPASCSIRYIEPGGTNNDSDIMYKIVVETEGC